METNAKNSLLKHGLGLIFIPILISIFMTWLLLFFHDVFSTYLQSEGISNKHSLDTIHNILINNYIYLYVSAYIVTAIAAVCLRFSLIKMFLTKSSELSIIHQIQLINMPSFLAKTVFWGWIYSIFQILVLVIFSDFPFDGFIVTNLATQLTIGIAAYSLTFFTIEFYNKTIFLNGIVDLDNNLIKENVNTLSFSVKIKVFFYAVVLFPLALFGVVIYFIYITNDSVFIKDHYQAIFFIFIVVLILGRLISALLLENIKHSFKALNRATEDIESGNYDINLKMTSVDELGLLMNNLNHMAFEINHLNREIIETQKEIIFTMGAIGESRSKETGNHVKRVAEYSRILAIESGLSEIEADILKQASPMHDIGKVGIPDSILNKPGPLTSNERKIMNTHAELGYEMLKNSERDILKAAAIVSYEHHEKWDGTGYPNNKLGTDIHIYGRITAIADVFDALGSKRVYKEAWNDERIFKLLKEERGKHFDPQLVDIFFEKFELFDDVRKRLLD